MNRDALRDRISITMRKTSLFRIVENILESGVLEKMVDNITEHLANNKYDRDRSLSYISEHLENGLEHSGVDLEDDSTDGVALAILFVYEEMVENKSDFFDKIQEKSIPVVPISDSDSEE